MNILPHNEQAYKAVKAHLRKSNRTCVVHPTGTGKSVIALKLIADYAQKRILYITSYAANLLEFWDKIDALGGYRMVLNLSNPEKHVGTGISMDLDTGVSDRFDISGNSGYFDESCKSDDSVDSCASGVDNTAGDEESRIKLLKKATEVNESFLTGPVIQFSLYAGLDNLLPSFDLIILDEFHRAGAPQWEKNVKRLLRENDHAKVVGFSATPTRMDGRDMTDLFHHDIASNMELSEAIISNLLPLPVYWLGKIEFELDPADPDYHDKLEKERKKKESGKLRKRGYPNIAKRHLESGLGLKEAFQEALIPEHATHGKFIVFCRTIRNTHLMMKQSEQWFDWVGEVHRYEMNHQNRDGLNRFILDQSDTLRLLFVVDMLTEGVHLDDLDGVIMIRPTESERVYFQQLGRALAVTSKREHPLIFDVVSNASIMKGALDFWRNIGGERDLTEREMDRLFHVTAEAADFLAYLEETEYDYYGAMKRFYEKEGHLYIPKGYQADGHDIYREFISIRGRWNLLSDSLKQKYTDIGMDPEITTQWMTGFWAAAAYFDENGNLDVPSGLGMYHGVWLYDWLKRNREKQNLICERQRMLLDSLGMDWTITDPWEEKYKELERYHEQHGHTDVPGDDGPLGRWVAEQRKRPPAGEKKEKLDRIGFEWDGRKSRSRNAWREGAAHAREYYANHKNLKVPAGFITTDGYKLGTFVKNTKRKGLLADLERECADP